MPELITTQLRPLTAPGTSQAVRAPNGSHALTATVTGAGAVAASLTWQGSNDLLGWVTLGTLAPSGTGTAAASASTAVDYAYWQVVLASLTGAQCAVSVVTAPAEGASDNAMFTPTEAAQIKASVSAAGNSLWANRVASLAAGMSQPTFTDIGIGAGTPMFWNGVRFVPWGGRYIVKNATNSVAHTTTTETVTGFVGFQPGQVLDGDILQVDWFKVMTGASGAETDTTRPAAGTGPTGFGVVIGPSNDELTNTKAATPAMTWRFRRINANTLRPLHSGKVAGDAAAWADTTNCPDMDALTWYLQISSKLTSGAVSATSVLRGFTVTHFIGA